MALTPGRIISTAASPQVPSNGHDNRGRILAIILALLGAVGLAWSLIEFSSWLFGIWSNGGGDQFKDRLPGWDPYQVAAAALVAAGLLAATLLVYTRVSERIAGGAAYFAVINDFIHLASRFVEATPTTPLITTNGAGPEKPNSELLRDALLAFITASGGRRRLPSMYLRPSEATGDAMLVPAFADGLSTSVVDTFSADPRESIFGEALLARRAKSSRNCARDRRMPAKGLGNSVRSLIAIPIREPGQAGHGGVYSVMCDHRRKFSALDEAFYRTCVSLILHLDLIERAKVEPEDPSPKPAAAGEVGT